MTRNKAMQTIEECGKIQTDNLRRNTLSNNLKVPSSVDTEWKIMHSKKMESENRENRREQ